MLRAMVFMDYLNFQIAFNDYYDGTLKKPRPRLDYNLLPRVITDSVPDAVLVKTLMCAPKPDSFLMNDTNLAKQYKWFSGLANQKYFDVIEGEYVARPTVPGVPMDINNRTTYYKDEKGTDINMAVEAITKGFNNAYDIAIFMSGDTDYLPIYRTLRTIGKLIVVAVVQGQRIGKIIPCVDNFLFMDDDMFNKMLLVR